MDITKHVVLLCDCDNVKEAMHKVTRHRARGCSWSKARRYMLTQIKRTKAALLVVHSVDMKKVCQNCTMQETKE